MDDNYIRNEGANSDEGCYVQSTCIEMEISDEGYDICWRKFYPEFVSEGFWNRETGGEKGTEGGNLNQKNTTSIQAELRRQSARK